jgi:L-amino acid N-acyltransferase YncA
MSAFCSRRGRWLSLRPFVVADELALIAMLTSLSAETVYARYLMPMPALSADMAQREVERLGALQRAGSLVLVATEDQSGAIVALAELARAGRTGQAEAAILVVDAYQREGIGRAVATGLVSAAPGHGITSVIAEIRHDNQAIRRLISGMGLPYSAETSSGTTRYRFAAAS